MLRPLQSSREDLTDTSHGGLDGGSSHFVPTPLNTPFSSNAQPGQPPNPQVVASALKQQQQNNPSLQNPAAAAAASSLTGNTSINHPLLQSKLVQQPGKDAQVTCSSCLPWLAMFDTIMIEVY